MKTRLLIVLCILSTEMLAQKKDSLISLLQTADDSVAAKLNEAIGSEYRMASQTAPALKHFEASLAYYRATANDVKIADLLIEIGLTYKRGDQFQQAVEVLVQARDANEKIGDKKELAYIHGTMADLFLSLRDGESAIASSKKELALAIETSDPKTMGGAHMNQGRIFLNLNRLDSSLVYYQAAAEQYKKAGTTSNHSLGLTYHNIAEVYRGMKRYEDAIRFALDALKFKKTEDTKSRVYTTLLLSNIYFDTNNLNKAIEHGLQGLAESEKGGFADRKRVALLYLSKAHEKMGNTAKALDYHKQYTVMQDSIFNTQKYNQLTSLKAQYEDEKKEQQLAAQSMTIALQKTERNQLMIGIIAALILVVIALIAWVQKSKSNKVLAAQKSKIEKQNAERELLLKEIHHRVKNNLQVISSLLSMQSRNMADGDAKDAVREGQGRIKSMSLIHQKLYSEDNLSKINMKEYLEELSDFLFKSYRLSERITRSIQAQEMLIDVDTAVPIGLIVNELISNALKYAFEPGADGMLEVSLVKDSDGVLLRVSDTGKGLPAGYEQRKSMGMRLVKTLVQQIEGRMYVENAGGTHFLIRFRELNAA